jgi:hypothetical protein
MYFAQGTADGFDGYTGIVFELNEVVNTSAAPMLTDKFFLEMDNNR